MVEENILGHSCCVNTTIPYYFVNIKNLTEFDFDHRYQINRIFKIIDPLREYQSLRVQRDARHCTIIMQPLLAIITPQIRQEVGKRGKLSSSYDFVILIQLDISRIGGRNLDAAKQFVNNNIFGGMMDLHVIH